MESFFNILSGAGKLLLPMQPEDLMRVLRNKDRGHNKKKQPYLYLLFYGIRKHRDAVYMEAIFSKVEKAIAPDVYQSENLFLQKYIQQIHEEQKIL